MLPVGFVTEVAASARRAFTGPMPVSAVAASVAALTVAAVGARAAAGPTLVLKGGRDGPVGAACGATHSWRYYSPGSTVIFRGRVAAGSTGTVDVVVERCYSTTFRVINEEHLPSHDGRFGNTFVVHARSDCFVQATYAGRKSPRAYFRVR
jgi:hypothetical protein